MTIQNQESSFDLIDQDLFELLKVADQLQEMSSAEMRLKHLQSHPLAMQAEIARYCDEHGKEKRFLLLLLELVFLYQRFGKELPGFEELLLQANDLDGAHRFYFDKGGLIYYQAELLAQLREKQDGSHVDFFPPSPIKVEELSSVEKGRWVKTFYDHFEEYAELYPIGGAADRLNNSLDGVVPLPAAKLSFCDQFLLERLFADLRAKEEMYFKLTGKRVEAPVVLMTSMEQKNHAIISELLKTHGYFGKDPQKVKIVSQPLVPASDEKGRWIFLSSGQVMTRPAGHGIFWQLLAKEGVLSWLEEMNIRRALVRQINNPIAGLDDLLTLLIGAGIEKKKEFGFASTYFDTQKGVRVQEGCNVVMRTKLNGGYSYALSNLEYTHPEFSKEGEKDWYQIANANLLYIDLSKSKEKISSFVPPPFINRKMTKLSKEEGAEEKVVVRLETTIQSISEHFTHIEKEHLCVPHDILPAFLLLQRRKKTLSAIKKIASTQGAFEKDTPELCLFHFIEEAKELLKHAGFALPSCEKTEGLPFIFLYSPDLGPYYSVISQKLKRGSLSLGSELLLMASEVEIEDLHLSGSVLIATSDPHLRTSHFVRMKSVRVLNQGLGSSPIDPLYWKGEVERKERLSIVLGEGSELDIEDVSIDGSQAINVPPSCRLVIRQGKDGLTKQLQKISRPTLWNYRLQSEGFLLEKEKRVIE